MGKLTRYRNLNIKHVEKILNYNGFYPITKGRELIFEDNSERQIIVERDEIINPKNWVLIMKHYNLEMPSKML